MQKRITIDGVAIRQPTSYQPIFSTTSTASSARTQDLVMHNTPIGTIAGYDIEWESLTWTEISTILNAMLNKSSFSVYHPSPLNSSGWITSSFYASDFTMAAQNLKDGQEKWTGLKISIRSVRPV